MRTARPLLDCSDADLIELVEAAHDMSPVSGFTHDFYRYPARFSPKFVRAAVTALSSPGDLVLDPFMGGGTTLVEALALGRHAVGADISSLATFISDVKTTLYSDNDFGALKQWAFTVSSAIHMHREGSVDEAYASAGYYRHMANRSTWRLRKAIEQALATATSFKHPKLEFFARCAILRTAQWSLDGRKKIPTVTSFRAALQKNTSKMIEGARDLRIAALAMRTGSTPLIRCINRSTKGLESEPLLRGTPRPKLVLTSPPYPGVHVLYHRWQIEGRKETPAPFWIANKLDGSGASYYTMGDRKAHQQQTYFSNLRASLCSVAALCSRETTVVQVMAFSDPSWQLSRYLSVANDAGFREFFLPTLENVADGRLWRLVPNRKWHANQKGNTNGSHEVIFFHRLAS